MDLASIPNYSKSKKDSSASGVPDTIINADELSDEELLKQLGEI